MSFLRSYLRVLSYLKQEKKQSLAISGANIILAIIAIAEPVLFGRVIDAIAAKANIITTLAWWVGFGLFNILAYVLVARGADRLAHRCRLSVLTDAFERLIQMPLSWHHKHGTSQILHTLLRACDTMPTMWLEFMRQHLATMVALLILIPTAFAMEWRLSIVLLTLGFIYILIAHMIMQRTKDGQTAVETHHHCVFDHINDSISNIAVVQSYNRIEAETNALRRYATDLLRAQNPVLNWWALASGLNRMASTISMMVVLLLGAFLVAKGEIRVGQVVAFIGFAQLLIGRLDQLSGFIHMAASSHAKLEQFFTLYDETKNAEKDASLPALGSVKGAVRFDHVSYEFPTSSQGVYDISFTINPGQTVAIVGPTGAGKTTLINLLQRVFDPHTGRIEIDGQDIRNVNRTSLRQTLATVFQEAGLFNRTIRENIAIGNPKSGDEELYSAAQMAAAHDFILAKSQHYNTHIGERGDKLSGGERQRLAIARAILKNAPILILDEATSALDVETELRVKDSLKKISSDRTTIIIAHRLSTIRHADMILFMEKGRLVEQGAYQELATKGGRFSALLQAGGFINDEAIKDNKQGKVVSLHEAAA